MSKSDVETTNFVWIFYAANIKKNAETSKNYGAQKVFFDEETSFITKIFVLLQYIILHK